MHDPLFWLYADNYRTYNIDVARKLKSINSAILLSELASRYRYHRDRNELTNDTKNGEGWFYCTQEDIEERTCLTRKNQDTALEILTDFGLIEKKVFGIPAKRYFRLNQSAIQCLFFSNDGQTSLSKPGKLDCPKRSITDDRKGQTSHYIYKHKEEPNKEHTPLPPNGGVAITTGEGDSLDFSYTKDGSDQVKCDQAKECSSADSSNVLTQTQHNIHYQDNKPDSSSKKQKQKPLPKKQISENIQLTEEEHSKLLTDYGEAKLAWMLQTLDAYKGATGKKYASDYHVLKPFNWVHKRYEEEVKNKNQQRKPEYKNETINQSIRRNQNERWIENNGDPDSDDINKLRFD